MSSINIPRWSDHTREERFFTAVLFSELLKNPQPLGELLVPRLGESPSARVVDVGYEVCLFRDLGHAKFIAPSRELRKQTIDLVLTLSTNSIVLIEAKAHQSFSLGQVRNMRRAREKLLDELGVTAVHLVGLHSSRYRPARVAASGTNLVFATWNELRSLYPAIATHVDRADEIYAN